MESELTSVHLLTYANGLAQLAAHEVAFPLAIPEIAWNGHETCGLPRHNDSEAIQ